MFYPPITKRNSLPERTWIGLIALVRLEEKTPQMWKLAPAEGEHG